MCLLYYPEPRLHRPSACQRHMCVCVLPNIYFCFSNSCTITQQETTNNKQPTTKALTLNPCTLGQYMCTFNVSSMLSRNPTAIGPPHVNVTCVFTCTQTSIFASLSRARKHSEARWRVGRRQLDMYIYTQHSFLEALVSRSARFYKGSRLEMNCSTVEHA